MKYFFQGISFKPKHTITVSPKKKVQHHQQAVQHHQQDLKYDGSMMQQIRQNLQSIKHLIQNRNEKR
tara:strand:+ start:685 stop:885 length:201 start_codon:yes stop_codon:yes gene_type:complete